METKGTGASVTRQAVSLPLHTNKGGNMNTFIKYFAIVLISIAVGYAWRLSHEDYLWNRQLETSLKHELNDRTNKVFRIPETNIVITKRQDGSGVIRIIE